MINVEWTMPEERIVEVRPTLTESSDYIMSADQTIRLTCLQMAIGFFSSQSDCSTVAELAEAFRMFVMGGS